MQTLIKTISKTGVIIIIFDRVDFIAKRIVTEKKIKPTIIHHNLKYIYIKSWNYRMNDAKTDRADAGNM
jgi:hypothetical protein